MANLTLCIPAKRWHFVLQEVRRILSIGGRLELVDDEMVFPYAKDNRSPTKALPPIPHDSVPSSPGRDISAAVRALYNDDDPSGGSEGGSDLNHALSMRPSVRKPIGPRTHRPSPSASLDNGKGKAAQNLERVFDTMLTDKFFVHPRPSDFLIGSLRQIFGQRHASLMNKLQISLAPAELSSDPRRVDHTLNGSGGEIMAAMAAAKAFTARRPMTTDTLRSSPGLVVGASTFVPMPAIEVEMHALKNIRVLLSCKSELVDFVEVRQDGVRVVDQEFWDVLADYEE